MQNLPLWLKILIAVVLTAILYGATEVLLYLDQTASGKAGLD